MMDSTPQTGQAEDSDRAGIGRYLRNLSIVLVLGGVVTIGGVALFTLVSRQAAVSKAEESARKNPNRPTISIWRAKGESKWRVLAYGNPADWDILRFIYELDGGWIVRIDVEKKEVEAVLSRGYWRDLLDNRARAVAFIGGLAAALLGIVLRLLRTNGS